MAIYTNHGFQSYGHTRSLVLGVIESMKERKKKKNESNRFDSNRFEI